MEVLEPDLKSISFCPNTLIFLHPLLLKHYEYKNSLEAISNRIFIQNVYYNFK